MAWIELHQTLPTNKKTLRLKKILKIKTPQAIGHLCLLWLWALDNAEDGDLSIFSDDEVSEVSGWTGKPETFVAALIEAGFLDEDHHIHHWEEYAGALIDKREVTREQNKIRQQARRDKIKNSHDRHASVTRDNSVTNENVTRDNSVSHAPIPYLTVPNRTVPYHTVPEDTYNNPDKDARATPDDVSENPEIAAVMTRYMDKICASPSRGSIDELLAYVKNLSGAVVLHAIDIACDENKRSWSYIRAILRDYQAAGINTLDAVQLREAQRTENKENPKRQTSNPFLELLAEEKP
jgi:DnaD/phage-associated family protein